MDHQTDPIYQLAASTAGSVGNEFLALLVRDLHDVMPVSLAMVTQALDKPPTRVRALYSWRDGTLGSPVEYDLEGTPCQLVYQGQRILIPSQLAVRFPKEPAHRSSYCGMPIRNRAQEVTGHFAIISNEEVVETERLKGIFEIFGRRVETELQRVADDEEKERLIHRLEQQHREARHRRDFMSKILGMVAHDLRNPLASVISRSEFIRALLAKLGLPEEMAPQEKKLAESVSAILRSSDRMERMIANLLEAASRETTEINLNLSKTPLSRAIHSAIGLLEGQAQAKDIIIEKLLDDKISIRMDEDRIIEAMCNLVSNSIKYSQKGSRIRISTRPLQDTAGAEIIVADEGLGMSGEDIASAFNAFQTLSAKPTGGETSTGLGLTIVKTIAEAHGGSIVAESEGRNKGSTMTMRLPG